MRKILKSVCFTVVAAVASVMVFGLAMPAHAVSYSFGNTSSLDNYKVKFRVYIYAQNYHVDYNPNDAGTFANHAFKKIRVYIPEPGSFNLYKCCDISVPTEYDASFQVKFDGNLKIHYEYMGNKADYSCTPESGYWIW